MRIRKLEIQGFKSFPDRTAFHFGSGISGIVGSNGCGKSNVVDAVKWCLGEQSAKSLRGKAMGDVIFNGTQDRAALGLAEVSLSFIADDEPFPGEFARYEEVQITRRLFRDGTSEYLLNQQRVRLRDIQDLFLDTGVNNRMYSFIEQGRIGQIVNARPEQRRALFEEAAGISRFQARRDEAQGKLAETETNLERAGDIVDDLAKRLRALTRQVERANRYRLLRSRQTQAEIFLSLARFADLAGEKTDLEAALQAAIAEEGGLGRTLETREAELKERRAAVSVLETGVGRLRDELAEMEATRREQESARQYQSREMKTLQARQETLRPQLEQNTRDQAEAIAQMEAASAERIVVEERLSTIEAELKEARAAQATLGRSIRDRQQAIEKIKAEQLSLVSRIAGHRAALESASDRRFDLTRRQERLKRRQQEAGGENKHLSYQIEDAQAEAAAAAAALENYQDAIANARDALAEQEDARAEAVRRQRTANKTLSRIERDEARLRARLESLYALQSAHEGVEDDVRAALSLPGVRGTLAEHLDVVVELERPLASALGARLDAILADDDQAALAAAQATKGRAIVVSVAGANPPSRGFAAQIGGTEIGRRALGVLLGDGCQTAPTLDAALSRHRETGDSVVVTGGAYAFVSPRGELIVGEPRAAGTAILARRRQIAELEQTCAVAEEQTQQARAEVEAIAETLVNLEDGVADARDAVEDARSAAADANMAQQQAKQRVSELLREQQRQAASTQQLNQELREISQQLQAHDDQVRHREDAIAEDMERQEEVEEELIELQSDLAEESARAAEAREQLNQRAAETAGLRERFTGLQRAEASAKNVAVTAARQIDASEKELRASAARLEELAKDDVRLGASLQKIGERQSALRDELQTQREAVHKQKADLSKQEATIKDNRKRLTAARDKRMKVDQDSKLVHTELHRIHESLQERHQITAADMLKKIERDGHATLPVDPAARMPDDMEVSSRDRPYLEDLRITEALLQDAEAVQQWVDYLEQDRAALGRLGEVNLIAVQEYDEVAERHRLLAGQRDDLEEAARTIQQTIARLNRTCRERFRETFDRVNEHFHEIYPRLVGGGQARLALTNEEDLLTTGVEIFAQPPGKKLQSLSLLSGGETAMVAIALIFSLFRVKPSPFCLLDEVDAPLDEGNGARFNRMLQEMAERSQFIVITHNKKTMECADTLYGVTMDPPGVSTVISVNLD